jgi:hypothetical protein
MFDSSINLGNLTNLMDFNKFNEHDLIILFIMISIAYYIWNKNSNGNILIV